MGNRHILSFNTIKHTRWHNCSRLDNAIRNTKLQLHLVTAVVSFQPWRNWNWNVVCVLWSIQTVILQTFHLCLCLLGGSRWAPTRTLAPRPGSTPVATSIGTTKTCPISTDRLLAFVLLFFLLYNPQWSAWRIHLPIFISLPSSSTPSSLNWPTHSADWKLEKKSNAHHRSFFLFFNLPLSLPLIILCNDQQTSPISLPRHRLEHKNYFIPDQSPRQRVGTCETTAHKLTDPNWMFNVFTIKPLSTEETPTRLLDGNI